MAAVYYGLFLLAIVVVLAAVFLVVALVSLSGTQPGDRPAILRALAALVGAVMAARSSRERGKLSLPARSYCFRAMLAPACQARAGPRLASRRNRRCKCSWQWPGVGHRLGRRRALGAAWLSRFRERGIAQDEVLGPEFCPEVDDCFCLGPATRRGHYAASAELLVRDRVAWS